MADNFWMDALVGASSAAVQSALNRTNKYEAARTSQDIYDQMASGFDSQLKKFDQDYAAELSGKLTEQEIAARDTSLAKTKSNIDRSVAEQEQALTQQYVRSGIGGDALKSALMELRAKGTESYANAETELNAYLLEKAANRQSAAKTARTSLASRINELLANPSAQADAAVANANTPYYTDLAKTMLPGVVAGSVAGAGQLLDPDYSGLTPGQAFMSTENKDLLTALGVDPSMFKPQDEQLPKEVGGMIYTPTQTKPNFLGQTATRYKKEVSADTMARLNKDVSTTNASTLMNNIRNYEVAVNKGEMSAEQAAKSINKQIDIYQQANPKATKVEKVKATDIKQPGKLTQLWNKVSSTGSGKKVVQTFPDGSVLYDDGTTGTK